VLKRVPVLTKLQRQHETILKQNRELLESLKTTRRGTMSRNLTALYLPRLKKLITESLLVEERFLIPIIEECFDSIVSESIRTEHQKILQALGLLSSKLNRIDSTEHQGASLPALLKCATELDSVTREHFSREENVIFWFARICLSR
jgi:hemerythrin-like domain-containing protein